MNKLLIVSIVWFVALFCSGCTTQPLSGGSSQQGNGIVSGSIMTKNGLPAIATSIRIRSSEYVTSPVTSDRGENSYDAITDSTGQFSVSGIIPGRYSIEANDQKSSAALTKITITEQCSTSDIGTIDLKPYSLITGDINDTLTDSLASYAIVILGLERRVPVNTDGTFSIKNLPEGDFDLRLVSSGSTQSEADLDNIKALSGTTTSVVVAAGWRYSHRLYLNTTITGANVKSDVMNFPVLVRLTAACFDFSQVADDGADIRFTKADNTPLQYEIERWDTQNRRAEIWVKLDTLHGADSVQAFIMQWGNDTASTASNSASVFDTADGFTGVWHLSTSSDTVRDATGNGFHGTNFGSTTASGVISDAREFTGGSHIKIPGLLNTPPSITLSAWARSDTTIVMGQEIITLGDAVLLRIDDISGIGTTGSYRIDSTAFTMFNSGETLVQTGWHHIVFTVNSTTNVQIIYIDGIKYTPFNNTSKIHYTDVGSDTYIGTHGNGSTYFNMTGMIDEVRVNNYAVSADWVRLCFANEKPEGTLVHW